MTTRELIRATKARVCEAGQGLSMFGGRKFLYRGKWLTEYELREKLEAKLANVSSASRGNLRERVISREKEGETNKGKERKSDGE